MANLDYPEYRCWQGIRDRCLNPNSVNYHNYGARGISVCERWESFAAFRSDMGPRPSPSHSVDRINNDGDYEPSNCRWATRKEQGNNTRRCRFIEWQGQKYTIAQFAEKVGIGREVMWRRLKRGWTLEDASRPALKRTASTVSRQQSATVL